MILEERILRLIAIGASISSNCQPCLETNAVKALESGGSADEIAEAIWVGKMVRRGSASKMDKFVSGLNQTLTLPVYADQEDCECG